MLDDVFDALIDFEMKFQRNICIRMFHNSFVNNTLTVFPVPSEQRSFLPVNRSVNRLWYVSISLCKTKTYDDIATGVSPAITKTSHAGETLAFLTIHYYLLSIHSSLILLPFQGGVARAGKSSGQPFAVAH
jgi:hypothetical protein